MYTQRGTRASLKRHLSLLHQLLVAAATTGENYMAKKKRIKSVRQSQLVIHQLEPHLDWRRTIRIYSCELRACPKGRETVAQLERYTRTPKELNTLDHTIGSIV